MGESKTAEELFLAEAIKAAVRIAEGLVGRLEGNVRNRLALEQAATQYATVYHDRHGKIKVLGMSQHVRLRDVYTDVEFSDRGFLLQFRDVAEMENHFRQKRPRWLSSAKILKSDAITLANKHQYLNVLGQPGAGKSTLLKRLGLEALTPRKKSSARNPFADSGPDYEHDCIPVLIELKLFKYAEVDLVKMIRDEFATCGFPDGFADAALKEGKVLLLLDGLDEVPDAALDQVIHQIRLVTTQFAKNRFVTSCRTAHYQDFLPDFTDVVIADLDTDQIEAFIRNWFFAEQDQRMRTADEFIVQLRVPENRAVLELGRTPLLLTFLCLHYDENQRLPSNRSDLFDEALRILLQKWAAERRVQRPMFSLMGRSWEMLLLQGIAGESFLEDKLFFTRQYLIAQIDSFIKAELSPPKIDSENVLQDIEIHQGLFVKRAFNVYSFSHLSLHEYCAARYFVESKKLTELIRLNLFDPRWREIFLLACGMGRADEILKTMAQSLRSFAGTSREVSDLISWVNQVATNMGDASELAAARAIAFAVTRSRILGHPIARDGKVAHPRLARRARICSASLNLANRLNPRLRVDPVFFIEQNRTRNHSVQLRDQKFLQMIDAVDVFKPPVIQKVMSEYQALGKDSRLGSLRVRDRAEHIHRQLLQAFGLFDEGRDATSLSSEADLSLEKFVLGMGLICDCKAASLSLSTQAWSEVVNHFFT